MTSLKHETQCEGRGLALLGAMKQYECEDGGFPTTVRYAYQRIGCPTIYKVSNPKDMLALWGSSTNLFQIFPLQVHKDGT